MSVTVAIHESVPNTKSIGVSRSYTQDQFSSPFIDDSWTITAERLHELVQFFEPYIEPLLPYHQISRHWMNEAIRNKLLMLCESDCYSVFRVLWGRLRAYKIHPLKNITKFVLDRVNLLYKTRPIFSSDLEQIVTSFVGRHQECKDALQDEKILNALKGLKKEAVLVILLQFSRALENPGYVKIPLAYLGAIIENGIKDGNWHTCKREQ